MEWTFEPINFVAGRRGAAVEYDFYNKLEKLNVQARKRDKILENCQETILRQK